MDVIEVPVTFDCAGCVLVGVMTLPQASPTLGFVILPGGPNYRAGAHRQFVQLARRVAATGVATLRFDYRGMGDSTGTPPGFTDVAPDMSAALDALQRRCPEVTRVVLCGLCEGASSALLYCGATRDPRVVALVLLNPWVRSEATIAKTYLRHYYVRRLASRAFWSKLWRGGIDLRGAARDVGANASAALSHDARRGAVVPSYPRAMASALRTFAGSVLVVLSGQDLTAREFADFARADAHWRGLLERRNVTRRDVAFADHTFSSASARDALEKEVLAWLAQLSAPASAASRESRARHALARN